MSDIIQCYVMQGFVGAEPKRESAKYFWEGWRSLTFYESEFEERILYWATYEYRESGISGRFCWF